jgi:hypothetical protein
MPQFRQFNHEKEKISDAIGMSEESLEKAKDITLECILHCSSPSEIAEYLHKNADYDQILFMATLFIEDRREEIKKILK